MKRGLVRIKKRKGRRREGDITPLGVLGVLALVFGVVFVFGVPEPHIVVVIAAIVLLGSD